MVEGLLREECLRGECGVRVKRVCLSSLRDGGDLERLGTITIVDPGC